MSIDDLLRSLGGESRFDMCRRFLQETRSKSVLEVGVWRGKFAKYMLTNCPSISLYYALDPWRHLDNWNKPCNQSQDILDNAYREFLAAVEPVMEKVSVLKGTTSEMIHQIDDESLDFAYIDGDHTLRGITIDLISVYPKIRSGGVLAGDDYSKSIWQHSHEFEPTLVCPFAAYFAEAMKAPIYVLQNSQFAIIKPASPKSQFEAIEIAVGYGDRILGNQIAKPN